MITINGRSRKREALARGQCLCPFEFKLVKGGVGGAVWFEKWVQGIHNDYLFRTNWFKKMNTKIIIAPAGISPRGEIPRRHPSSSHVY